MRSIKFQFDVELFIATGDNIHALEAAELDKNERLTLILAGLEEQTISPSYDEMRQLLTSDTTGIIYWHLSPDNLTTFILTAVQPHPLVWNIENLAQQAQQLKEWIKTWDTQYADYRNHKSPKTQPSANDEPTENDKAAVALTITQIWLKTVTWQELANWLIELKQIPHLKIGIVDKLQSHITNTLEDGGTIGLDRPSKYSDPYHWAAFTLTGRG